MKYRALTKDVDEIDTESIVFQAAHLLDVAATQASKQGDLGALIEIARLWLEIAASMTIISSEEEEPVKEKLPYGFHSEARDMAMMKLREEVENGEETD